MLCLMFQKVLRLKMEKLFKCSYSCKHYFGDNTIMARNKSDALIGIKIKIEDGHINKDAETKRDCGKTCKLKIKIRS